MPKPSLRAGVVAGALVLGLTASLCAVGARPASAASIDRPEPPTTVQAATAPGSPVSGNVFGTNTGYANTVVSTTKPRHGAVDVDAFGSYTYTPAPGFVGVDVFQVSSSNAIKLFTTHLPALGSFGGVKVTGGGYGSSVTAVPGKPGYIYGLTDRGPNVDGPGKTKIEPIPSFTPAIGEFHLVDGDAQLVKTIPLASATGVPLNGQVNSEASTGETITDLDGRTLPASPDGFDSEGLVALPDGTFWVSDEYGPYIWHFAANGRKIGGYSPFDGTLPSELEKRNPNQGMEGLTLTPDGTELVGMMQSSLVQDDLGNVKPKAMPVTRIVTITLATGAVHEYAYMLTDPGTRGVAVSEITALSNTRFLVDERDGNLPPAANSKQIYAIDLAGATDIGPAATVPGSTYDATRGGLRINDGSNSYTVEGLAAKDVQKGETITTAQAQTALTQHGIHPIAKAPYLDLSAALARLNPSGTFFGHDKIEGLYPLDNHTLLVSNDSDFGLAGSVPGAANPFQLTPKTLADGTQDDGQYLEIDTDRISQAPVTTTVTITVKAPPTAGGSTPPPTSGGAAPPLDPTPRPGEAATGTAGTSGQGPRTSTAPPSGRLAFTGSTLDGDHIALTSGIALVLLGAGIALTILRQRRPSRRG